MRPRNRPPRPPQPNNNRIRRPSQTGRPTNVPSVQHVLPGAAVSIVLKADQPTGRQVQGVVQDILTRGNHPRGIKVRLQDGRVGRVQQMVNDSASVTSASQAPSIAASATRPNTNRIVHMERDVRLDEHDYPSEPPQRTFADYFPQLNEADEQSEAVPTTYSSITVKCPMCDFEGDEVAVSRHVDQHLT
jgi:uncharacterized repeat protein (TIGR03833 family)